MMQYPVTRNKKYLNYSLSRCLLSNTYISTTNETTHRYWFCNFYSHWSTGGGGGGVANTFNESACTISLERKRFGLDSFEIYHLLDETVQVCSV